MTWTQRTNQPVKRVLRYIFVVISSILLVGLLGICAYGAITEAPRETLGLGVLFAGVCFFQWLFEDDAR